MKQVSDYLMHWRSRVAIVAAFAAAALAGCASDLERRFQHHIDYLASDELGGRGVGSPGCKLAADYIADQFAEIGLEPAGDDGTYFQSFPIPLQRKLTDKSRLTFGGDAPLRQGEDFIPFSFSSEDAFEGSVVFCGYGIVAPDKEWDDFASLDLAGKVALILRGEPPDWADEDGNMTRHAMFRNKVYNAKDRGAVAVLIVNQRPEEGGADALVPFDEDSADEYGVPAFHITRAVADKYLARGGLPTLARLQDKLDAGEETSAALAHVTASGQAGFEKRSAITRNVVALVRGQGPKADEVVVIGAHYDHLGTRRPMMRKFKAGKLVREQTAPQIHNGADDNASGVSGLIEIGRRFAAGRRPARSILLIAFTAEETGLQGSKHYLEEPVMPVEETVAMLNLDMIGRMKPGTRRVKVFGTGCGTGFLDLVKANGRKVGLKIASIPEPGGNSDHSPFAYNEVPCMHFFSGHHSDYHKPSDDSDKINASSGAKVVRLVYRTARTLANQETRPAFHEVKTREADKPAGTPTYRVVMGLAPGYVDDGEPGMAVDAVNPDGPADIAGMKAGDRIIRIGGKDVANIYDYMAATRNNDPGDTVEVVVLRDDKELTLKVTLAAAR